MKKLGVIMAGCVVILSLHSCKNGKTANTGSCADSTTTTSATTTTITTSDGSMASASNEHTGTNIHRIRTAEYDEKNVPKESNGKIITDLFDEATSAAPLNVTSTAFGAEGVIPVKYTCDGEGATPPLHITNIPAGTKSMTLIIHDYHANADGGFTNWMVWDLDSTGNIPENYRSSHETIGPSKQYGYTPICAPSGNHRYHFMIYALDTKLVLGKATTKKQIEDVMRGHVLGKGELVGVYNKHLE